MSSTPKVIRLGISSKNDIKKMKKGYGPLVSEIEQIAAMTKATNRDPDGKEIHPVVLVYREEEKKEKKEKRFFMKFGAMNKANKKWLKKMGWM
ncbi:MAG: hypothetical protein AAFV95_06770 [Bacteroidota bacterium]